MERIEPPMTGHLIIVEPWVPDGQYEREVRVIGPVEGTDSVWEFEASEPLGWSGVMTTRLRLRPRRNHTMSWSDIKDGKLTLNGCLVTDDPSANYCGLIVEYAPTVDRG